MKENILVLYSCFVSVCGFMGYFNPLEPVSFQFPPTINHKTTNVNPAFVQSILDSTPAAPRAKHMADIISKTVVNVIIT